MIAVGLNVLELPTHPVTGVEVDALRKAILNRKISLCLFVTNFSNPLGSLVPDGNKREIVELCERYNVPIIESDLFGDLYFVLPPARVGTRESQRKSFFGGDHGLQLSGQLP